MIYATALFAQEDSGAILGRVTDNRGSAIPGALIRVVHTDTGVEAIQLGAGAARSDGPEVKLLMLAHGGNEC